MSVASPLSFHSGIEAYSPISNFPSQEHTSACKLSDNMSTTASDTDPFAFAPVQLYTDKERRDTHQLNEDDEIQRPDVVDDLCRDLMLQARIDRIVHGYEHEGGSPATLVVFGFRFHGLDKERRFKRAIVTILFQDEKKRNKHDPVVTALWPNGDFTLGEQTVIQVEERSEKEVNAEITGGIVAQGGTKAALTWERTHAFSKSDKSTLTGSIVLDTNVRYSGPKNAVRLTITENRAAGSGVVTDFRAAVLLTRKNDDDIFVATVKMKAKGNFSYNFFRGIRDLSGLSPPNDPVRFQPGVQYLRPPTLGDAMEAKLAEEVDANKLNAAKLDGLAGVLATTVLTT